MIAVHENTLKEIDRGHWKRFAGRTQGDAENREVSLREWYWSREPKLNNRLPGNATRGCRRRHDGKDLAHPESGGRLQGAGGTLMWRGVWEGLGQLRRVPKLNLVSTWGSNCLVVRTCTPRCTSRRLRPQSRWHMLMAGTRELALGEKRGRMLVNITEYNNSPVLLEKSHHPPALFFMCHQLYLALWKHEGWQHGPWSKTNCVQILALPPTSYMSLYELVHN